MVEEAIEVIRALWGGDELGHRGRYFMIEIPGCTACLTFCQGRRPPLGFVRRLSG
jgi:alkanesulfonate monooxygenase SsuD/methylene tetrahydromethanopterin reductase-like flavin-dependent oxidoreductase (luciferase family)